MKRFVLVLAAVLGLALSGTARAGWHTLTYSGYQPWWNIFAKRYKCLTPEEERLQKFWHDYYSALRDYYCALDAIDWVAYYKNHGYQINSTSGPYGSGRINYAPVFVAPTIQWAVPGNGTYGPATGGGGMMGGGMMGGGMMPASYNVPAGGYGGYPAGGFPGTSFPGN
jgi:hypothetical protein